MSETNKTDNWQLEKRPSHAEVDAYARELCGQFNNPKFRVWYCKVIYELGIARVKELVGRTVGAKQAGKLFSSYVTQERRMREKNKRFGDAGQ